MRWIFGYALLLLASCSFKPKPFNPEDYRKDPNLVCDHTMRPVDKRFDKKMREQGLYIVGAGGGRTDGKERIIGYTLSFSDRSKIQDINSAREMIVMVITTYLDILNNTKDIENCLIEYPFTAKHLNIAIMFHHDNGKNLFGVSSWEGYVEYYVNFPEKINQLETVHQETFAKAKAIVDQQRTQND